jgi:hypothetical protein
MGAVGATKQYRTTGRSEAALVVGVVALYTLALDGVNWVRTTVDFPSDRRTQLECWGYSSGIACGEIEPLDCLCEFYSGVDQMQSDV